MLQGSLDVSERRNYSLVWNDNIPKQTLTISDHGPHQIGDLLCTEGGLFFFVNIYIVYVRIKSFLKNELGVNGLRIIGVWRIESCFIPT